jgi:hypothetical protein
VFGQLLETGRQCLRRVETRTTAHAINVGAGLGRRFKNKNGQK